MILGRLGVGILVMCLALPEFDAGHNTPTADTWTCPCCCLSGRNLTYIPTIHTTCDCLNFPHNALRNVTDETFNNITFIRTLMLNHDNIRTISRLAFNKLSSLQHLDLENNSINTQDLAEAFKGLPQNIQTINLSRNRLSRRVGCIIPALVGTNITILVMDYCRLANSFNISSLSFLEPLRVLSVGYNYLYNTKGYVPLHLTNITLRNNYLRDLPLFCKHHSNDSQLNYIDVCNNYIDHISRSNIKCLTNLEYLYITNKRVKVIESSTFAELPRLNVIYFNNIFDVMSYAFNNSAIIFLNLDSLNDNGIFSDHVDPDSLGGCVGLQELSLSYNDMSDANDTLFDKLLGNLSALETLRLARCQLYFLPKVISSLFQLSEIDVHGNRKVMLESGVFDNLKNLKIIDISKNALGVVSESVFPLNIRNQLVTVKLEYNTYIGLCVNLWYIQWVSGSGHFSNLDSYRCGYPHSLQSLSIFPAGVTEQHCRMDPLMAPIILGLSIPTLVLLVLISLAYRWRWHIRYYVFMLRYKQRNNEEVETTFTYDAFVLYCDDDTSWVTHHLLPRIEADDNLQLCIHERNFTPGRYIVDNIMDNLEKSRKVVLVLSNHSSQSPWCQFELTFVQTRALKREFYLVVIVLEEIEDRYMTGSLYALLQTTTYIRWPEEEAHRCLFWTCLKQCLQQ